MHVLTQIWTFVRGDISATEFEQWAYESPGLELELGAALYLDTVSTDFSDRNAVWNLRRTLAALARQRSDSACMCIRLRDLDLVDMGSFPAPGPAFEDDRDWSHEDIFRSIEELAKRGAPYWWLWAGRCRRCAQCWLVAQEERHYDVFCMKKLALDDLRRIADSNVWPPDFDSYEAVLELARTLRWRLQP